MVEVERQDTHRGDDRLSTDLRELGVAEVDVDRLRQVGRSVDRDLAPSPDRVMRHCATRRLAITSWGSTVQLGRSGVVCVGWGPQSARAAGA